MPWSRTSTIQKALNTNRDSRPALLGLGLVFLVWFEF